MDATRLAPLEPRSLDVKGAQTRYFAGGAGEGAVVLVHGLGGAASNWVDLVPDLAHSNRVLVPELPGHGGSEPLPAPPTTGQFAERIERIIEHERAVPALVVGHSMGAVVVLRVALRRPDLVSGLVLAGAAGIASASRRARHLMSAIAVVKPGKLVAPFHRWIARSDLLRRAVFGSWGAADARRLSRAAIEGFLAGPPRHTDVLGAALALARDDPREHLERVRCPCLVLWGTRDLQVPIADGFDYARRLRAELRAIPDCAHLLIGERPDACLDAIRDFAGRLGHAAVGVNGVSLEATSGGDRN